MEGFLSINSLEIKIIKEDMKELFDLKDDDELEEEQVEKYMELYGYFQEIADEIKTKVYDITGYESEEEEEAEEEAEEAEETKEAEP